MSRSTAGGAASCVWAAPGRMASPVLESIIQSLRFILKRFLIFHLLCANRTTAQYIAAHACEREPEGYGLNFYRVDSQTRFRSSANSGHRSRRP
ncbi:exported hypothetical protein [Candidatus Sulfopaludibacter sp. SbA6]|nr:exported hypothetical protein [Candidatus Sulfopaludibacter sp. SbA6]